MKNLIRRTITGISLVVLFAGSILLGPFPFLLMVLLVYGLSIMELYRLLSVKNRIPGAMVAISGALIVVIVFASLYFHLSPLWLILPAVLWITGTAWPGLRQAGNLVMFWQALPYASFIALGWFPEGHYGPLIPVSVIALVWIHDTFAYVTGSLIGRHPLTPRLSPGKTWEGSIGGLVFTLLAGWIAYRISGIYTPGFWMVISLITSLLGLAGDLFESGLKRRSDLKDTGNLLPGHGGILDRFDSLLFVAPALLLLITLFNLLQ